MSETPGRFQRFRNSFRKKKKKRGDEIGSANAASAHQNHEFFTKNQAVDFSARDKESLKDLIQTSKVVLESINKKKQKKKKPQSVDLSDLQRSIDTVKQCFWTPHGKQKSTTDESFGFHNDEHRSRNRSRGEQVEVHSREQEPVADYNLSLKGRDPVRSYEDHRPKRSLSVDESSKRSAKRLQEELKVREEANENLQYQIKKLKDELSRNARELDKEIKSREDAQNRLSEMMGRQLKSNNPAITDLSDPDRPLNLVDKFCNIYDNEWTDVIDEIEKSTHDETTAVKILLTLVTDAYIECYKLRHQGKFFVGVENRSATVKRQVNEIPEDCKLLLKGLEASQLNSLKQALLSQLQSEVNRHILSCLANKPYIIRCLELCWMMVCHSPPIHLEWNYKGYPFDTSILKPFTEPGATVEFMVWPVVYLHKDGPLLYKGVAQGCGEKQHTQF